MNDVIANIEDLIYLHQELERIKTNVQNNANAISQNYNYIQQIFQKLKGIDLQLISINQRDINSLKNSVSYINSEISTINDEFSKLKTEYTNLAKQVYTLQTDFYRNLTIIKDINDRLSNQYTIYIDDKRTYKYDAFTFFEKLSSNSLLDNPLVYLRNLISSNLESIKNNYNALSKEITDLSKDMNGKITEIKANIGMLDNIVNGRKSIRVNPDPRAGMFDYVSLKDMLNSFMSYTSRDNPFVYLFNCINNIATSAQTAFSKFSKDINPQITNIRSYLDSIKNAMNTSGMKEVDFTLAYSNLKSALSKINAGITHNLVIDFRKLTGIESAYSSFFKNTGTLSLASSLIDYGIAKQPFGVLSKATANTPYIRIKYQDGSYTWTKEDSNWDLFSALAYWINDVIENRIMNMVAYDGVNPYYHMKRQLAIIINAITGYLEFIKEFSNGEFNRNHSSYNFTKSGKTPDGTYWEFSMYVGNVYSISTFDFVNEYAFSFIRNLSGNMNNLVNGVKQLYSASNPSALFSIPIKIPLSSSEIAAPVSLSKIDGNVVKKLESMYAAMQAQINKLEAQLSSIQKVLSSFNIQKCE